MPLPFAITLISFRCYAMNLRPASLSVAVIVEGS
jgi:hypothetical protein